MVPVKNSNIKILANLPEGCGIDDGYPCLANRFLQLCFCEGGIYKEVGNTTTWTGGYGRGGKERGLETSFSVLFRIDTSSQVSPSTDEKFIVEVRPQGSSLWTSAPNIFDYGASGTYSSVKDHPNVTKGKQLAATIGSGSYIDFYTNFYVTAGTTAANAQYRVFKAYESSGGVQATSTAMLFMVPGSHRTLNLASPRAICNTPQPSISAGLQLSELASVPVGATMDNCASNYVSCSGTYQTVVGSITYTYKSCSMDLVNFGNVANHWFVSGWDID
jgi:hypothetical protein